MRQKKRRKVERMVRSYCSRNWLLIVAACYAQFEMTTQAILKRGCVAFGGETLVLPAILIIWEAVRFSVNSAISHKEARECVRVNTATTSRTCQDVRTRRTRNRH